MQKEIIRKFLRQPCLTYYNQISDKRTAVDLLRLYPDSVDKLYLLLQIGGKGVLMDLFYHIMKKDSLLFYRVIRETRITKKKLRKIALYAVEFNRREKLNYLIGMGVNNFNELALVAVDNNNPELAQELLNLAFEELHTSYES